MVNIASVSCDAEKKNDEQLMKTKRDASIGTFSYTASDITKYDGSHVKTVTVLKNIEMPSVTDTFSAFSMLNSPQKKAVGKTTVEYWPPDMDKEKFYSMKKGSATALWPEKNKQEGQTRANHNQPLPENIPDIPINMNSWTPSDIYDYQPLIGPTESSIIDTVSITDPGPVVFPTLEPTSQSPDRTVIHISRTGHKKRKLKKKVKLAPSVPFVETSEQFAPYTSSVIETTTSDRKIADITPIYEIVDEPYVNIYKPNRYTDVVSNLSNLTEMSFGERTVNKSNDSSQTTNFSFGDYIPMDKITVSSAVNDYGSNNDTSGGSKETVESSKASADSFRSINKAMPLDRLLNQLKQAIDERDIAKIKNIALMMEEPKSEMEKVTVRSTTEVANTELSSEETTLLSSITSTTVRNKVYLAPRVRNAQKKFSQTVTNAPTDEKQISDKNTTLTEASISTSSNLVTENTTIEVAISNNTMQARRGRSYVTSRVKSSAARSRQAAKNISRRIGRKHQS